jgi:molecular chaperone GrpE
MTQHPENDTPVQEENVTSEQHPEAGGEAGPDAVDLAFEAAEEAAAIRADLEEQRNRASDLEQQLLRRAAEFQNYRRRTQEDLQHAASRGRAEVIERMVEVLDDLRRSREAAEEAASGGDGGRLYEVLKEGVDLVYRKFEDRLAAFGVRPIEAVGQQFDEALHEALMQQESDKPPGTVLAEIQKGYTMGDRVLRHAQVVVAG